MRDKLDNKSYKRAGRPELLAPAGNMECLVAAALMGADAVYLSGKEFGARSYADNFDREQLKDAVKFCHLRGVKVHVTVNTIVGDKELSALEDYFLYLDKINADALIIQDLGVLRLAKRLAVRSQLHASTQLTVHSLAGAKSAVELGFDRIVLSRELSFEEIKYISDNCGVETEIFVHGAMCMSYSGQCLMSSMLGGRSGNRGKCAQPCRQAYKHNESNAGFYLSLKDMSLANQLDKVIESGAASLKIEGRMKGSAYVGCVVKTYADCLRENRKPTKAEIDKMNRIFYRGGQSSGYFDNKIGTDMFTFNKPDNPYKSGSDEVAKQVAEEVNKRRDSFKIKLFGEIEISAGEKIRFNIRGDGLSACVFGDNIVETASSKPVTEETVLRQIKKTGGSVFEFDDINIIIKNNPFVPLKELNDVRRKALDAAEDIILKKSSLDKIYKEKNINKSNYTTHSQTVNCFGFTASVADISQYRAIIEFEHEHGAQFSYISVPMYILQNHADELKDNYKRIVIEPPAIVSDKEYDEYTNGIKSLKNIGFERLYVHNISGLQNDFGFNLHGSWRLNTANSLAACECAENGISSVMPSLELSLPQIRDIAKNLHSADVSVEVLVYGYIPLMTTENCIVRNFGDGTCPCGGDTQYMTDRLGKRFPIMRDGESCRSVLLNSCPVFMADKIDDLKKAGVDLVNIRFSIESKDVVKQVCGAYFGIDDYNISEFTRIHFYKGII